MNQLTLLFQLPGFSLDQIEIQAQVVALQAHVQASEAACPLCQHPARRVHSHSTRTLHDLPCGTRSLRLFITVRRFFCDCTDCPRKIFVERLPDLTRAYARTTTRFTQAVEALGFALGGKAAVRLGTQLGLARSRTTMLRTLRRATPPPVNTPRILGVDDWAFRRGSSYGTLLVDLERSQPVDLLPDRQANTLAKWLQAHPGVEVISRDRAGEYALGARQGAPQALQVADRFHVLRNLADTLEKSLHPHRRALKQVHLVISTSPSALPAVRYERPARRRDKQRHQQEKRDLYETIRQLGAQGMSQVAIGRLLHLNRKTVASYLHAEQFPERAAHPLRPSILTPYEAYLYGRWQEGYHNVVGLYREIQAQGYSGSHMPVQRYLLALRGLQEQGITLTKGGRTVEITPRRA